MATELRQPETYWTKPNQHCPNSKLPVLVYRNVLPDDLTEDSVRSALEKNDWKHGGTFKHYPSAHYHENTHEAYVAIRGSTRCLYGVGPFDDESDGVMLDMKAGDVAVHAAGVAHKNLESSEDYLYMGFYPSVCSNVRNAHDCDTNCTQGVAEVEQQLVQIRYRGNDGKGRSGKNDTSASVRSYLWFRTATCALGAGCEGLRSFAQMIIA